MSVVLYTFIAVIVLTMGVMRHARLAILILLLMPLLIVTAVYAVTRYERNVFMTNSPVQYLIFMVV